MIIFIYVVLVFQMLVDETRSSLYQLQMVSKNLNQTEEGMETLNTVCKQLATLMDSLQVTFYNQMYSLFCAFHMILV